jgi:hypothetical protein
MEEKDFSSGFVAPLIVGFVAAGAVSCLREKPDRGELGLSEDAAQQEVKDALWRKRLSDLGLTGDSVIRN